MKRLICLYLLLSGVLSAQNLTLTVTPASAKICSGSTIIMQVSGATSYTWSPGIGLSGTGNGSTQAASPSGTTTYTVYGVSGTSSGSVTVTITVDTIMSIDIAPKSVTLCPSQSVVLTARSAANSYTWSPSTGLSATSGNTVSVFPSSTQTYTVQGSDAFGCTGSNTITINIAPSPNASGGSIKTITCASPSVTLSGSGGSTYTWAGPHIVSGGNTPSPLVDQQGVYSVTVTSVAGCTATSNVTVAQDLAAPSLTVSGTQTLACSPHTAVISTTVSPSNATYSWTGSGITSSSSLSYITINQPGTFYVVVTNPANGCQSSASALAVNAPGVPTATITAVSSGSLLTCTNQTVMLQANTSPSSGLSYNWSNGSTVQTIPVTSPGVVTLSVTNQSGGCTVSTQYTVSSNVTPPALSVQDTVPIPCTGHTVVLAASSIPSNAYYSWTGPNTGSILSGVNTASPTVGSAGNYTVTATDPVNGCKTSSVITVTGHPVHAAFTASPSTGSPPLNVSFANGSSGAIGYQWFFGNGYLSSATNPSYVYSANGSYTVVLVASHGACTDTAYTVILVHDPYSISIPNVFTPNGDMKNDTFFVTSQGLQEISLTIYNRWGAIVFDATGQDPMWNGDSKDGGKAAEGDYFYVLSATDFNGDKIQRKGNISLFR